MLICTCKPGLLIKRSIRFDALALGLALAVLVALAYARSSLDRPPPRSVPSTYDTGRNGYRALFDLLQAEQISPSRFERPLGLIDRSIDTLVLASPAAGTIGRNDLTSLKQWVRAGGRLIVLDTAFGGPQDALLGLPNATPCGGPARAQPVFNLTESYGVRRVRGVFTTCFAFGDAPKAIPLLANSFGIVAIAYPFGNGRVVAITDPTIFSNAHIAEADNARFAYNLLGGAGHRVAFDERVHGYAQDKSFWEALPRPVHWSIGIIAAAVLLGLLGANLRFAPAISLSAADERDSSAYIASMGRLLARGHASGQAVRDCADAVLQLVRRRFGGVERIGSPQLRENVRELERLRGLVHPSDSQLLAVGRLSTQIRKELS
ncbi:MAG: DUF4350 domain-containing protein [Candidatus Eremiobacteraeota bacterium]|nr:DUF4350 domain-containing protein [Candidatus Eremiobacteraeota bacterium]